jgi:hypothetical protein
MSKHDREDFTLAEQRHTLRVVHGGRSRVHVVRLSTFPAGAHPGRWTRRAADYRSLCGSISYCMTGIDAEGWGAADRYPLDISDVDCSRCRDRASKWAGDPQ